MHYDPTTGKWYDENGNEVTPWGLPTAPPGEAMAQVSPGISQPVPQGDGGYTVGVPRSLVAGVQTGPMRVMSDPSGGVTTSGYMVPPGADAALGIMGAHDFNSRYSGPMPQVTGDPVLDAMQRLAAHYLTPQDMSSEFAGKAVKGPNGYTFQGGGGRLGEESYMNPAGLEKGAALAKMIAELKTQGDTRNSEKALNAAKTSLYNAQAGEITGGAKGGVKNSKGYADQQTLLKAIDDQEKALKSLAAQPGAMFDPDIKKVQIQGTMVLSMARAAAAKGDLEKANELLAKLGDAVNAVQTGPTTEGAPTPSSPGVDKLVARYAGRGAR